MTYDTTIAALADPTRRALYERIRRRPHAVGELARAARISQPAASQHLRVLREARLVTVRRDGARRLYGARPAGLGGLRRWVESRWDDAPAPHAGDRHGGGRGPGRAANLRRERR